MNMMERAALVFGFWALGLGLFNPWMEGRRRRIAMICCLVAASFCIVLDGVFNG